MKPNLKLLQKIHDAAKKCTSLDFYICDKARCIIGCAHKQNPKLPEFYGRENVKELNLGQSEFIDLFVHKVGLGLRDKKAYLKNLQKFIKEKGGGKHHG